LLISEWKLPIEILVDHSVKPQSMHAVNLFASKLFDDPPFLCDAPSLPCGDAEPSLLLGVTATCWEVST
jgi:hypothetical protein